MADAVGIAYCFVSLGWPENEVFTTPVNVGGGRVKTSHGDLPVPPPATLELLRSGNLSFFYSIPEELATPTGVSALVALEAKQYNGEIHPNAVGYGFGDREIKNYNSFTRIMLSDHGACHDTVLETNVDDVTGEMLGYTMERLFEAGAKDVSFVPVFMKKNRPGTLVKVLCDQGNVEKLAEILFMELGTFGVRYYPVNRITLERDYDIAHYGDETIGVKNGIYRGKLIKRSVEYDDAREIALKRGIALREIYRELER